MASAANLGLVPSSYASQVGKSATNNYSFSVGMAMGMSMTSDPLHHSMNGLSYNHGIFAINLFIV